MDFSSLHRKSNVEERECAERCPREAGWFPVRSVEPSLALDELRSRGHEPLPRHRLRPFEGPSPGRDLSGSRGDLSPCSLNF